MKNITLVSGYWLPPKENAWWHWKNSHHSFEKGLANLFASLDKIDKNISFVFLYNKYSKHLLPLREFPMVIFWDITDYYDWKRPYNHWVKFAMVEVIWRRYGPYMWFDADSRFTDRITPEELAWIGKLENGVAFLAVVPELTTTYEQFGLHLDLSYETKRERLVEIFGLYTKALVNTAVYIVNDEKYANVCREIAQLVLERGITPYDDEWGHVVALLRLGISLADNESLSLRNVWPKCIEFHHDVTRFYGQNYY